MKFPLSWLKEYISISQTNEELATLLTQIGLEVEGLIEEDGETLFELSLTPNLFHTANLRGLAREIRAVSDANLTLPEKATLPKAEGSPFPLRVEAKERCPLYTACLIEGVRVEPSPPWLVKRLEQCNIRPCNNVVDATNYVLMELGQPLHAFDLDKIKGEIDVRLAKEGESIEAIDHTTYHPTTDTLLIADQNGPLAIAGILGGAASEVSEKTTRILLESAYFEPTGIRRAAKRLGISTDASRRFERGADPQAVHEALARAAHLIIELAGGSVASPLSQEQSSRFEPKQVSVRVERANALLGTELAQGEIEEIFERLSFSLVKAEKGMLTLEIPTYRVDIHEEIDLVEEIIRFYGYHHLKVPSSPTYRAGTLASHPHYMLEQEAREACLQIGLQEFITCDLINDEMARLAPFPSRALVKLLNPQSKEHSVMRPSLLPGLLAAAAHNINHGIDTLRVFEVGRVHFKTKNATREPLAASILLMGNATPVHFDQAQNEVSTFHLKGIVEALFSKLRLPTPKLEAADYPMLHPGRQMSLVLDGQEVGVFGEVHPSTLKGLKIDKRIYFAEFDLQDLSVFQTTLDTMRPLPTYPSSSRDWTFAYRKESPFEEIRNAVLNSAGKRLESWSLLDLYHGEKLGSDWMNVTLRFVYRDPEKTISHEEVETEHARLMEAVTKTLREKVRT